MSARARNSTKLGLVLVLAATPATAQERPTVLEGGEVHPVNRPVIRNGVVIMAGGKIQVVGSADTAIPADARVIDCQGKVITPGLVDAATTLGVAANDQNEQGEEVTPQMHIVDSIDPADKDFARARRQGVTTVQVSPGNRNVIGGLGAVLKTRGDTVAAMLMRDESCLRVAMGSEPSRGNRPIRYGTPNDIYYRRPTTRMGVIWEVRKAFYDAEAYRDAKTVPPGGEPPPVQPGLEVLLRALDGKLQVRTTARAEQDIRSALRLADEFGYHTVIEEATEAWLVADDLANAKVPVVFGAPSASADTDGAEPRLNTLNLLAEKNVPFAIASGSRVGADDLVREAMFAVRNGTPRDKALAAITLVPARILGVDDRVGSLEAGKDADVVVWSGDPFDPTSTVSSVYVGGTEVE